MTILLWLAAWVLGTWAVGVLIVRRIHGLILRDGDTYDGEVRALIRRFLATCPVVVGLVFLVIEWVYCEVISDFGWLRWLRKLGPTLTKTPVAFNWLLEKLGV